MRMQFERKRDDKAKDKEKKKKKPRRFIKKRALRVNLAEIDYKNLRFLQQFVSDRGKIVPRRVSNVSSESQRAIALAVRRARMLAWIPYSAAQSAPPR